MQLTVFTFKRSCGAFCLGLLVASAARADNSVTSYALGQALTTNDHVSLYRPSTVKGFNINGSYFAGYASGVTQPMGYSNFNDEQRLYAMLVDGRYDFDLDHSPITPHLSGGMGMASTSVGANLTTNGAPVAPLLRVGSGVAYRLGEKWDMSLDYQAGYAAMSGGDQVYTGRGQQTIDMQALNIGMHYTF